MKFTCLDAYLVLEAGKFRCNNSLRGSAAAPPLTSEDALQQAWDAIVREAALDIIHEAAGAATAELSAEVAVEVMAGIAMGPLEKQGHVTM